MRIERTGVIRKRIRISSSVDDIKHRHIMLGNDPAAFAGLRYFNNIVFAFVFGFSCYEDAGNVQDIGIINKSPVVVVVVIVEDNDQYRASKLVPKHTRIEGAEVKLNSFLTSAPDGGEWLHSRPVCLTPEARDPGTH